MDDLAEFVVKLPRRRQDSGDKHSTYKLRLKLPLSSSGEDLEIAVSKESGIPRNNIILSHDDHQIESKKSLLDQSLQKKNYITGIVTEELKDPLNNETLYKRRNDDVHKGKETVSDKDKAKRSTKKKTYLEDSVEASSDFSSPSDRCMKEVIRNRTIMAVENEVRIVLVGKTGSGKSALANTILGKDLFKSEPSMISVTKSVNFERAFRFGRNLLIVDTPGMFDTDEENETTLKEISKCVGISAPGIHAALLVTSIGRVTPEDQKTFELFMKSFGENVCNFTILVFNRSNELEGKTSRASKKYLENAHDSIQTLRQKLDDRIFFIDNKEKIRKKDQLVPKLLDMIDLMVASNKGKYYTNEMYLKAEKFIRDEEKRRRREAEKAKEEERRKIEEPLLKQLKERDARVEDLERRQTLAFMKADKLAKQLDEEKEKLEELLKEKQKQESALNNLQGEIDSLKTKEEERSKEMEELKDVIDSLVTQKDADYALQKALDEQLQKQCEIVSAYEAELEKRYEERNRIREDVGSDIYEDTVDVKKDNCCIS